jgi:hypothetical protein
MAGPVQGFRRFPDLFYQLSRDASASFRLDPRYDVTDRMEPEGGAGLNDEETQVELDILCRQAKSR